MGIRTLRSVLCRGVLLALICAAGQRDIWRPDPLATPGNSDAQSGAPRPLCSAKWGVDPRNSPYRLSLLKRRQLQDPKLNYVDKDPRHYEEDLLIPRALGGTDSLSNLWPQPKFGKWNAAVKNKLEKSLRRRVCLKPFNPDFVALPVAQRAIAINWIAAYQLYMPATEQP